MPDNLKDLDKRITLMENEHKNVMELLSKIEERVDDIHKYLFEWALESKYVSRTEYQLSCDNMKKDVESLKSNQTKVAWILITAIVSAIAWLVIVNPFS